MSPEAQQEPSLEPAPAVLFTPSSGRAARTFARQVVAFKFGGSSLLGAERMLHAATLVRDAGAQSRVVVVVSAMKGITDRLLQIAASIEAGRGVDARREAEYVLFLHLDVLRDLRLDPVEAARVGRELRLLGKDLQRDVEEASRSSDVSAEVLPEALHDRLASYGERFCARLFAAALQKAGVSAVPVSSSEFVLTCDRFRDAQPLIQETRQRGREILLPLFENAIVPVVTGFIGSTSDGRVTTLGRNSSDFSGALIAHVVDAAELVIWTDVDGIYTANPHESAEARLLHHLSYEEAHALASSGAKVLHAKVLPLAAECDMVVWVRNTFNPCCSGTRIGPVAARGTPSDTAELLAPRGCHNSSLRGEA